MSFQQCSKKPQCYRDFASIRRNRKRKERERERAEMMTSRLHYLLNDDDRDWELGCERLEVVMYERYGMENIEREIRGESNLGLK